ncbi:hypothetical protein M0802_003275 [Mischocyttarus mexicanus]|nr:hypothetical protein M0802_003275 [Mischocyttarus mexicanus]
MCIPKVLYPFVIAGYRITVIFNYERCPLRDLTGCRYLSMPEHPNLWPSKGAEVSAIMLIKSRGGQDARKATADMGRTASLRALKDLVSMGKGLRGWSETILEDIGHTFTTTFCPKYTYCLIYQSFIRPWLIPGRINIEFLKVNKTEEREVSIKSQESFESSNEIDYGKTAESLLRNELLRTIEG